MDPISCNSIVVKLGTFTLTAGTSSLSPARMVELVRQMAELHRQGCKVVLVSSGAIAAGRERLAFPQLPQGYSRQANAGCRWAAALDVAV